MWNLKFHNSFVFRSPAHPFSKDVLTVDKLLKIADSDDFREAIYISSPALFYEMQRLLKGEIKNEKDKKKLIYSLSKYIGRIGTRCTPFGLFAGTSTGNWGEKNEIRITKHLKSHTRLDMDYVCMLTKQLSELSSIRPSLLFYPNNSIYVIGDEIRYVEYTYIEESRAHNLKTVDKTEYVLKILDSAKNGKRLNTLVELLINDEISNEEACAFIDEMVKTQLLVSELEPAVTGEEFMAPLIRILESIYTNNPSIELNKIIVTLKDVDVRIKKLDVAKTIPINEYTELMQVIKQLNLPIKEKTILQADAFYEPLVSTLNLTIQNKLIKVIEFLKKFSQPYQSNDLANFKNKYIETYEEKELPLLEVLDKESGIGYPNKDQLGVNPLVEEFLFAQQGNGGMQYDTSFSDQFLLKKLIEAYKNDVAEISFKDEDLSDFPHPQFVNTTITMSIMFRLIDAKKDKIYVSLIGGNSSAANLLGRFAHGEGKILNIIQEIAQFEKNAVEDRIIAEIVHLPQSRIGNIVLRPIFRDYEIPYLGKSALPTEYQISMEDIMVSVKNNRIVLRSKKLNKEVLPRLSSAHNYSSYLSLPVYKFLGDMQIQDVNLPALLFNWGRSSFAFKFLPRAEYEGVVLIPATWNLIRADYEVLLKEVASDNLMNEVKSWVKKWKMPRHILLKDADNELFIDLESELSVKTFLDTIKKRGNIELVEFLFDAESALVLDEKGSPFTNEIIAVLFNNDYIRKDTDNNTAKSFTGNKVVNKINNIKIKRTFPIGSEWLFYKIYCGVKSADKILIQVIKPLVDALTSRGLIEKWFFIRYNDPDFHIRVRFFNSDINNIGEIIKIAYHHLNPLQEKGIISKIMIDTYIRELERYSSSAIGISEEYYSLESNMALQLLSNLSGENSENIKLFYALRSIDDLLDIMQFTPGLKLGFMEFQKNNFINEHGGHKDLKLRLDDKFRRLRKDIENILTKKKDNEIDSISVVNILNWRKQKLLLIIPSILKLHEERQLETSLNTLLSSYLHMNINRIFLGKQRTYEMVIYDILYRYYKSMIARESKDKKAKTKIN